MPHGRISGTARSSRPTARPAHNAPTERTSSPRRRSSSSRSRPRDAFRGVRLTAPLKKSLVAKRKALEAAMEGYKKAAYNVAEVTTAATYEMAELYRTLAHDVLSSERPKGLKGDELEEYNSLLEEQVFPFEEEAITAHELNTARARDGVYDEWVQKSYKVLAELNLLAMARRSSRRMSSRRSIEGRLPFGAARSGGHASLRCARRT